MTQKWRSVLHTLLSTVAILMTKSDFSTEVTDKNSSSKIAHILRYTARQKINRPLTGQHGHGRGFTSTVVTQQHSNLPFVHIQVQRIDCHFLFRTGIKHLRETINDSQVPIQDATLSITLCSWRISTILFSPAISFSKNSVSGTSFASPLIGVSIIPELLTGTVESSDFTLFPHQYVFWAVKYSL